MDNNFTKTSSQSDLNSENSNNHKIESSGALANYPLGIILVLSFIVGVIGGLYGSLDLANRGIFQRWFGDSNNRSSLQQTITVDENSGVIDVVRQAGPAVVSVVISRDIGQGQIRLGPFGFYRQPGDSSGVQQVGAGTGFFVTDDGLILTNRHVVADESAEYTVLTNDGKNYQAQVVARDTANDLALLKIDIDNAPFLTFADSSQLELGQQVIAIGNSLGEYQNTVTTGVVSGIDRDIFASGGGSSEQLEGVIQTDAAINPGNSGGPLLNLGGSVVGINTAMDAQGQLVGFAIPADDARAVVESYQKNGKIVRPFLGVRYLMINSVIAQAEQLPRDYGALIIPGGNGEPAILSNSPAARAGLQENQIILEVNNQRLTEDNSLSKVLKSHKPGDELSLRIYDINAREERSVNITVGER